MLQLIPNPFDNEMVITIQVREPSQFSLKLLDLDGKKIIEENISVSAFLNQTLNLENLPSGVYFLSLESENGKAVERIVKK